MKTEKIVWGLILVFIGGILLLQNFGVISFQWGVIWRFWPLVLILIGANMLLARDNSGAGSFITVVLTIAALSFIAWQGSRPYDHDRSSYWFFHDNDDENRNRRTTRRQSTSEFSEPFTSGISHAVLNISGGATEYTLKDSTSDLFRANVNGNFGNYSLVKISKDSSETLQFKMAGKGTWKDMKGRGGNKAEMYLNNRPVWDIHIETGAGATDLDLSAFKVRNFTFQGGVSSVDIRLGEPQPVSRVSVETGVSHIRIRVPASAACRINTDSGLSSNNFTGFVKQEDGSYISSNYNGSGNRFIIDLKGGLSDFEVERY